MATKTDIFSLLKADHRKVESLFSKLEDTTERAVQTREKIYAELRMEITAHSEGEEKAIYPDLKEEKETEEIGFESVEEHSIVKFLIKKLDHTPCDSKEWTAQITALKEVIEHHVEEEESEMFKQMREAFSEEELHNFATEFLSVKEQVLKQKPKAA